MPVEENKATIQRMIEEVWNKGNVDVLDDITAPNYARILVGQDKPLDREGQKRRLQGILDGLSDHRLTILNLFGEDDRVVFHFTVSGTHLGPLLGVEPTGKPITLTAIDIARFENGKIVDHWGGPDIFDLRRQLGLQ
jgi:predicted ester cyclase